MTFRQRFLLTISNPNLAYLLLMLGLLGLYFEFANPGAVLPGVLGGISLLLAIFSFQILPINYVGLLLIVLAIAMFILEVKVHTFGALSIGGIVAMVIGSMMLINSPVPELRPSLRLIIPVAIGISVVCIFLVTLVVRAHARPAMTGREGMVGEIGTAQTDLEPEGKVFVHGELWDAVSDRPVPKGGRVAVVEVEKNLKIKVTRGRSPREGENMTGLGLSTPLLIIGGIVIIYILNSIKVLREYERGVIFRLGRVLSKPKGPGIILVFSPIDRIVKVSLRLIAMDIPPQDIITRDNVSVKVNAVLYFRVVDPLKCILEVQDFLYATSQLSQTTLRSVLGQVNLDDLLSERDKLNARLQEIIDKHTDPWGIKVQLVEMKHVDLPENMTPGHRQTSRGRTRTQGQGHPRRRRIPGRRQAHPGRRHHFDESAGSSAQIPGDLDGNRRRKEFDDRLPSAS